MVCLVPNVELEFFSKQSYNEVRQTKRATHDIIIVSPERVQQKKMSFGRLQLFTSFLDPSPKNT